METLGYLYQALENENPSDLDLNHVKRHSFHFLSLMVTCGVITTQAANAQVLREGSRGEQVRTLQEKLSNLGYLKEPVSTKFDSKTRLAVQKFQKDENLPSDGVVGPATQAAILEKKPTPDKPEDKKSSPELKLGDKGKSVRVLQHKLKLAGFNPGIIDGVFGQKTLKALNAFQKSANLPLEGFIRESTWSALDSLTLATKPIEPEQKRPFIQSTNKALKNVFRQGGFTQANRYVVVVFGDENTLNKVREYAPSAFIADSGVEPYIDAGAFGSKPAADLKSSELRSHGFSTQVIDISEEYP